MDAKKENRKLRELPDAQKLAGRALVNLERKAAHRKGLSPLPEGFRTALAELRGGRGADVHVQRFSELEVEFADRALQLRARRGGPPKRSRQP